MNHRPNISKPPTAAAGCGECLAPIGGRHEWSCSQVDAATFTAALTAPRRRRWQRWLRPAEFLAAGVWFVEAIVAHDLFGVFIGSGFLIAGLLHRRTK